MNEEDTIGHMYACEVQIFTVYFSPSLVRRIDLEPTGSAVAVPHTSSQLLFGECIANGLLHNVHCSSSIDHVTKFHAYH